MTGLQGPARLTGARGEIEDGIDRYLVRYAARRAWRDTLSPWTIVE